MGTLEGLVNEKIEGFGMKNISHLEIIRQITKGLHHLHLLDIVHGNLKPTNVLVSYPRGALKPMIKLVDFGLLHRDTFAFTEGWMCPFDCRDPVTLPFDVFSLGCLTAFIVSNGTHPFGTDPNTAISNRQPMTLFLDQIESGILSAELLRLIDRMLHYDAEKRPSTSDVLGNAIFHQLQETQKQSVVPRPHSPASQQTLSSVDNGGSVLQSTRLELELLPIDDR